MQLRARRFRAAIENLYAMLDFVETEIQTHGFEPSGLEYLRLALEEAVVNVIRYAYSDDQGTVEIRCGIEEGTHVVVMLIDEGQPFDPLSKPEVEFSSSPEERPIGGLGIFLLSKLMDELAYRREDGKNILTMKKNLKTSGN